MIVTRCVGTSFLVVFHKNVLSSFASEGYCAACQFNSSANLFWGGLDSSYSCQFHITTPVLVFKHTSARTCTKKLEKSTKCLCTLWRYRGFAAHTGTATVTSSERRSPKLTMAIFWCTECICFFAFLVPFLSLMSVGIYHRKHAPSNSALIIRGRYSRLVKWSVGGFTLVTVVVAVGLRYPLERHVTQSVEKLSATLNFETPPVSGGDGITREPKGALCVGIIATDR